MIRVHAGARDRAGVGVKDPTVVVGPHAIAQVVAGAVDGVVGADRAARVVELPPAGHVVALVATTAPQGSCCWAPATLLADVARLEALLGPDQRRVVVVVASADAHPSTGPDSDLADVTTATGRLALLARALVVDGPAADWAIAELADRICTHRRRDMAGTSPATRLPARLAADDALSAARMILPDAEFMVLGPHQSLDADAGLAIAPRIAGLLIDESMTVPAPVGVATGAAIPVVEPTIGVVVPPRPHHPRQVAERIQDVLWSGRVKHGNRYTTALTTVLEEVLEVPDHVEVLTTATGSAALRLAYEAVAGFGHGATAAVPAFTFAATAETLVQLGYRLHLVDVDPDTWCMDPAALDRALAADPSITLVVPVDALGAPCDHDRIATVAATHDVPVVADSAAALGATLDGRPISGHHQAHAYSLSFAKTLTAGGAGGVALLDRDRPRGTPAQLERSSMMSELHAVVALDQFTHIDDILARRTALAAAYDEVLSEFPFVSRQQARIGSTHAWVHYVLRLPDAAARRQVAATMGSLGLETKPYYAPSLDDASWAHGFDNGHGPATVSPLPITQQLAGSVLAVPMSSALSSSEGRRCTAGLRHALEELGRVRP